MYSLDVKTDFQARALLYIPNKGYCLAVTWEDRRIIIIFRRISGFKIKLKNKKKQNYAFHSAVNKLNLISPCTVYVLRPGHERPFL